MTRLLSLVNDQSMIKRWAILKSVSDSYLKDKEFDNAIKYYDQYLACKPDVNSDDMEGVAKIYSKYADEDEARKAEFIKKAIEAYRAMVEVPCTEHIRCLPVRYNEQQAG